MRWFDAHLDLACLAALGRDMEAEPARAGGPWQPATLTLRSMHEGNVRACMGTIFTEAGGEDAPVSYPVGDAQAAHAAGVRQLDIYHEWVARGLIEVVSAGPGNAGVLPVRLSLFILMEGADPIREPAELAWWAARGVRAVGLAWARGTRYAGGNSETRGLTGLGRDLIREIDRLGLVHDLSHLSDAACDELLTITPARVIASHSNCRALLDPNQRHLRDETIREIARRGGVVGLNLVRNFIRGGLDRADPNDRPSINDAIAHVEHVCDLAGHRRSVGMGSDLDGGITGHDLPRGIDSPCDFSRLAEALAARGWSDADVRGFAWGNWARFWGLPADPADA